MLVLLGSLSTQIVLEQSSTVTLTTQSRMTIAIFVSLTARILNSVQGHIFCYSAISSAGVVLILPGFLVCKPLSSGM